MEKYLDAFINAFSGTVNWTWKSMIFEVPWYTNYVWGLTAISLIVWFLEMAFPWRKEQSIIRKDFWLDTFYMFFNFFLLNLIVLIALSNTVSQMFDDILGVIGLSICHLIDTLDQLQITTSTALDQLLAMHHQYHCPLCERLISSPHPSFDAGNIPTQAQP